MVWQYYSHFDIDLAILGGIAVNCDFFAIEDDMALDTVKGVKKVEGIIEDAVKIMNSLDSSEYTHKVLTCFNKANIILNVIKDKEGQKVKI